MLFCRRKRLDVDVKLLIDGEAVDEVQTTKFLGITIDNKLSWKYHIDHISGKITRGIGMIIKAREYLNKQGLLSLYYPRYPFIYPYLTYHNHIWGSTYKSMLRRLIILQNKAVKIIAHARFRASCDPIYKELSIMKLENINTYLIGRFMHCVFIQKPPEPLRSLFNKIVNTSLTILDLLNITISLCYRRSILFHEFHFVMLYFVYVHKLVVDCFLCISLYCLLFRIAINLIWLWFDFDIQYFFARATNFSSM